jgi:DNA-binding XRE family transcriptional regulator
VLEKAITLTFPVGYRMSDLKNEILSAKTTLSTNLKRIRKSKSMAQERLAFDAGVDRTVVSKIERQVANPSLEIIVRLAVTLDVTVTELLG